MCGIAGMLDVAGRSPAPRGAVQAMAEAITHRGPDEDGFYFADSVGLASRRLSIVGLADGRQPIANEDQSVWVVFNGEFFDYREQRAALEAKGHRFRTSTDTEILPHLWEEYGEGMLEHLHGQFAFALYNTRSRELLLARDRFGICPLFYTSQPGSGGSEWLLFASEIKALIASGHYSPAVDPRGIHHAFTYFATPGPATCFAGVTSLLPGQFLRIKVGHESASNLRPRTYWQMNFPDAGQEKAPPGDDKAIVDAFEKVLLAAVDRRLKADVPVVSYLSGGVDSSIVVAMACKVMGRPIPTFTIGVDDPTYNEENEAQIVARHVGANPIVVKCRHEDILNEYPGLIRAAEAPVIDTACSALLMLARKVRENGYKVALTGEGSDEWMAGYPWFNQHALFSWLDCIPGVRVTQFLRRAFMTFNGMPKPTLEMQARTEKAIGGFSQWLYPYGLMSSAKTRLFSPAFRAALGDMADCEDLGAPVEQIVRWSPLNRGLYLGGRVQLPGLLLSSKGDRVSMHNSVEVRYPFLDETVYDFLAALPPRWKLRGLTNKYILRRVAERWLPKSIAWRKKVMFRAMLDSFQLDDAPLFIRQLVSEESLRKTGYFDLAAVRYWRENAKKLRKNSLPRQSIELGLVGVAATQLWHHTYLGGGLADLPAYEPGPREATVPSESIRTVVGQV